MCLPPRPADECLRERLAQVRAELGDIDLEPGAVAALQLEADKLNRLLNNCFQSSPAISKEKGVECYGEEIS
jgi:hypothetical protein